MKNKEKSFNAKRLALLIGASLLSLIAIACTACILLINFYTKPLTAEAGKAPDLSHIEKSPFISVKTDIKKLDCNKVGQEKIKLCFFGFLEKSLTLSFEDTVAPKLETNPLWVTLGTEIDPSDMVSGTKDATKVTLTFGENAPDTKKSGEYTVEIIACDEGGNITKATEKLTVSEKHLEEPFESGTDIAVIEEKIKAIAPESLSLDLSALPLCGSGRVYAKKGSTVYIFSVELEDTVPPRSRAHSIDIPIGYKLTSEDIVPVISDATRVTAELVPFPDCNKAGEYEISVILTDEGNNTSEYNATVYVHDINTEITVEAKSNNTLLASLIFGEGGEREGLRIMEETATEDMNIGENTLNLWGKYSKLAVKVNVVDTVAPVFYSKTLHIPAGTVPPAIDLVSSCYDCSSVAFSYEGDIPKGATGNYTVTLLATDTSGNSSSKSATIVFVADREKPYLEGVRDITVSLGEEPDYFLGIEGFDTVKGPLKVDCDTSLVDINTPGTYKITYSVDDGNGNVTSEGAYVTVLKYKKVCLDVEYIPQFPLLPCGCEVVSLATAMKYEGIEADPAELYCDFMPKGDYVHGNPWEEYIGDPFTEGMGCYAPCLELTGNAYLESIESDKRVTDISGLDIQECKRYIDKGIPVIIWCTMWMLDDDSLCWTNTVDGETVVWHSVSHCAVLIGYTDTGYIFSDPMRGIVEYGAEETERAFEINFRQACIIE